jgi:hypothetical protein
MRLRIPEIFLGVFLTVAVFAMGILFSPQYSSQTTQADSSEKTSGDAAKKDPPKPIWQSAAADPVAAFTLGLLIVGIFQAGFFFVQLRLIRESLTDAKTAAGAAERAAKATEDAVELSRQTSEHQLRAYLFPKFPKMMLFNQGNIGFHQMLVRNYGQTPADDVVIIANTDFLDLNPIPFPSLDDPDEISKSTIAPKGEINFTTATAYPLTIENIESVASGDKAFFVWGQIRYNDAFGRPQTTDFRLRFGKAQLHAGKGEMMICDDGNKAT